VIWERRHELGLSQEEAAFACGLDRSYFGTLERGEHQPRYVMLLRVARGLGLRADVLLARALEYGPKEDRL
jgi:transcriptional regulator with XRE-family HTH domain